MTNSADPDQLASSEANWSGSTLFAKTGHVVLSKRRVKTYTKHTYRSFVLFEISQLFWYTAQYFFTTELPLRKRGNLSRKWKLLCCSLYSTSSRKPRFLRVLTFLSQFWCDAKLLWSERSQQNTCVYFCSVLMSGLKTLYSRILMARTSLGS